MKELLSFVIPCYRSEKTIQVVVNEIIDKVAEKSEYDYEIIAVNDCSPDGVLGVLKSMARDNYRIKVIDFAKNMGKHSALMAGYGAAKGKYIVTLDDDFQSPVNMLWELLEPLEDEDCDCTTATYSKKEESFFKRFASEINLLMTKMMLEKDGNLRFENFSAMKKFVVDEMVNYKNPYPFLEGLVLRVTNKVKMVPMEQRKRNDDNVSGFTLRKSFHLFLNGLTAFSVKPLRIASIVGVLCALVGLAYGMYVVIYKLINPSMQAGYSSMISIMLFFDGIVLMFLGLLGEYIGRIYICINDSPQYVIREKINLESKKENEPIDYEV